MFHIIYFSSPWCSKCKITGPNVRSVASYYNITIQEVNCDDEKDEYLVKKYDVMSLPTIVILEEGRKVFQTEGLKSLESLLQDLDPIINKIN